jgi:hypothetical protein
VREVQIGCSRTRPGVPSCLSRSHAISLNIIILFHPLNTDVNFFLSEVVRVEPPYTVDPCFMQMLCVLVVLSLLAILKEERNSLDKVL